MYPLLITTKIIFVAITYISMYLISALQANIKRDAPILKVLAIVLFQIIDRQF